jgi:magnesium-transporting ATPase (P-type)
VEATVSMAAFLAVLVAGGWSYGATVSSGTLATASGAAFTAVVLGQMANAIACRSSTRPVWRLRWRGNPFLLWAILAELVILVAMLVVPAVADLLGQRPPSLLGLLLASCAVPAVLAADALHKALRARLRDGRRTA